LLRFLLVLLGAAVALLLAVVALAWRYQERIVWQPPRGWAGDERWPATAGVRRVTYAAEDGQPLFGYLVGWPAAGAGGAGAGGAGAGGAPGRAARRVLVAFHGNAETAASGVAWARRVARETGWAVLLAEYRGYAGLPGVPSYEGSQRDARAAHAWVRDALGVPPSRIGVFGFSLGSAVATELASEVRPPVLVLQAPFTSARDMARVAGTWPVGAVWEWIARVHFDTRARVAALDVPVWVIHGGRDMVVPVRMGRTVHAAARRPGRYLELPGAGHNDLPGAGAAYWTFLREALR
jgi:pimeloyl-ACP methyl ester carboxylesterase